MDRCSSRVLRTLFATLAMGGWCVEQGPQAQADLLTERRQLDERYRTELVTLADQAMQSGLPTQAEQARHWLPPAPPFSITVSLPPRRSASRPSDDAPAAVRSWDDQFRTARRAYAAQLFALAQKAMQSRARSLAWLWAHDVLREDPEHAAARWALGYQAHQGEWLTSFELAKAKSGQIWSDRFGWLPRDELTRYERGERLYRGKWMSAAEESALRSRIDRGWELVTEHFSIRTNHSLEAGARLALELERLSNVWHALFITFLADEKEMQSWFDGKTAPRKMPPRHQIWYFRSRDEYVTALQAEQPWIANTTGYYDNDKRRAYLFDGLNDRTNVYHEATHQLFAEHRPGRSLVGQKANFWIIEGIACYMESLVEANGQCRLGGLAAVRLNDARIRLLRDQYYEPFASLVGLGMLDFQQQKEIKKLYSQVAGQTYFLLEHNGGAYREATIEYLTRIYQAKDQVATLHELLQRDYSTLDREYREFLLEVQQAGSP